MWSSVCAGIENLLLRVCNIRLMFSWKGDKISWYEIKLKNQELRGVREIVS